MSLLKDFPSLPDNHLKNKMIVVTEISAADSGKLVLLFGAFDKEEARLLFTNDYQVYQLPFASTTVTREEIQALPLKEVGLILIKQDTKGLYLKQLAALRNLKLHVSIPIILYVNSDIKQNADQFKKFKVVDDVITSLDDFAELEFKVKFLQRYKQLASTKVTIPKHVTQVSKKTSYIIRRSFDIVVSSLLLLILSPVLLLIAIAVKLESKGPIFYISKRAGKHYRIFKFYKFRTMVVNADKKLKDLSHLNQYGSGTENSNAPSFLKIKDDPRITRVGSFLRNTSLDELPQLINVLLGHMSLVGNRPLPLYEAATLTSDHWANRFDAPAGMTGLWQIMKRGESDMSTEERIELDITYAKNNSLIFDLWIMVKTPFAMMQKSDV